MTYTDYNKVAAQLGGTTLTYTSTPSITDVNEWISEAEAEINERTGFTYSQVTFTDQIYDWEHNDEILRYEDTALRYDGSKLYTRESGRVVKNDKGKAIYYEGWIEDITDVVKSRKREIEHFKNIDFLSETALLFVDLSDDVIFINTLLKVCRS